MQNLFFRGCSIYHLKQSADQVMNKRKLPNKVIEGIFRKWFSIYCTKGVLSQKKRGLKGMSTKLRENTKNYKYAYPESNKVVYGACEQESEEKIKILILNMQK